MHTDLCPHAVWHETELAGEPVALQQFPAALLGQLDGAADLVTVLVTANTVELYAFTGELAAFVPQGAPLLTLRRLGVQMDALLRLFDFDSAAAIYTRFSGCRPFRPGEGQAENRWRLATRRNGSLLLVKDFVHHNPRAPHRDRPISVAISAKGVTLFAFSTAEIFPPNDNDLFQVFPGSKLSVEQLAEFFTANQAAEIYHSFRLNRPHLFNVIPGGKRD